MGITIDKVVLYGSYAKGRERTDSDIDVAIVSKDFGKDRTEEGMMLFRIAGSVDVRLEPASGNIANTGTPIDRSVHIGDNDRLMEYHVGLAISFRH